MESTSTILASLVAGTSEYSGVFVAVFVFMVGVGAVRLMIHAVKGTVAP